MKYLLEISKIIDGGVRSDRAKVNAYAEQLARKLDEDSDPKSANRIRECLKPLATGGVAVNDLAAPSRLPVDSESRLHLADEIRPDPTAPFIAIPPESRAQVAKFISYIGQADRLMASGVGIAPSMLIYGPPGCGKTVLAKYIASALQLPLLIARSDSLISSYLGSTSKNLRMLFEHAMSRPSILFLDEFDAFAKVRDDQHELGELKRVVVSLLQNIDALDSRTILLAASNHEHLLDPAVWRRFTYKLPLSLPAQEERAEMFMVFLRGFQGEDSIPLLVAASDGLNGSQIRHLCEDAVRDSIIAGATKIDETDLLRRIVRMRIPSIAFDSNSAKLIKAVHNLGPRIFIGVILARIFNTSPVTISRRLKEAE